MDQRYVRIQVDKVNIAVKESYTVVKCLLCDDNQFIEVTQIITHCGDKVGDWFKVEHKVMVNKAAISLISSNEEVSPV